jgi:hypothetical protein
VEDFGSVHVHGVLVEFIGVVDGLTVPIVVEVVFVDE